MIMRKIRKGDEVVVNTGRDRGKRGTVLHIGTNDRVLVEGVNVAKKHMKPNPNRGISGGIVQKEMPIHISNIAMYNPQTHKGDRVGIRTLEDGRKVRCFKSNGEVLDV
jgi:large subunit ribosomal protein L24